MNALNHLKQTFMQGGLWPDKYMVWNEYLIRHLQSLNLWSRELKDKIIVNDGSVIGIEENSYENPTTL